MIFASVACLLISALCALVMGHIFISYSGMMFQSKVRDYTPAAHQKKNNTPTMGGIFFLLAALLTAAVCMGQFDAKSQVLLVGLLSFALIGFGDDYLKIKKQQGIWARTKFMHQWIAALTVAALLVLYAQVSTLVQVPLTSWSFDLGYGYIAWAAFIIVACANAVNLTDGLDGLATGTIIPPLLLAAVISLNIGWISGFQAGLCLVGSLLGFLWYNAHPAKVFMGDVGSLALGAALALLFLITKQELLIPLAGGIFLLEELSVMLQVLSFKLRKKRIFKMAPIHHHFELSGLKETKIVFLFSAISGLLSLIAFALTQF